MQSEADGWTQHERLGIEDPFETSYDIAHVIKSTQMLFIHKEFLVRPDPFSAAASLLLLAAYLTPTSLFPFSHLTKTQKKTKRAHTIISRAFSPTSDSDALPCAPDPKQLLQLLMEAGEPPPFSQAFKEANKVQAQGGLSSLDEDLLRDADLPAFAF